MLRNHPRSGGVVGEDRAVWLPIRLRGHWMVFEDGRRTRLSVGLLLVELAAQLFDFGSKHVVVASGTSEHLFQRGNIFDRCQDVSGFIIRPSSGEKWMIYLE